MTGRRALLIGVLLAVAALLPTARAAAQTFESADLSLLTDMGYPSFNGTEYNEHLLTVRNAGPSDVAAPVKVTANLVAGETFVSGPKQGWSCAPSGAQQVVCTFAPGLKANDQTTFSFIGAGGNVPCDWHDAVVSSPTFDPNTANNAGQSQAGSGVCGASAADTPPAGTYTAPTKGPPTTSTTSTTRPTTVATAPSSSVESGTHPATQNHVTTDATVLGVTFTPSGSNASQPQPLVAKSGIEVFDELAIAELVFVAGVGLLLLSRTRMRLALARTRRH